MFPTSEERMINRAANEEIDRIIKKRGLSPEEISAEDFSEIVALARGRAECSYWDFVDMLEDDARERRRQES